MYGYAGKIAYVDLTKRDVEIRRLEEDLAIKFIGGSGIAAKMLYDLTNGSTDPLGKDNVIIFMTGPLTGTNVPLSGRHEIVSKSPLTGIYGESDCGGFWGTALKKAGFDGIVVKGVSSNPVYLWVSDGHVEFKNASHLWGMDTYEIAALLKSETHSKAVVASIGQAGEGLVPLAAIMHDGEDGRAAGRCGLGAVMGSKKLKAIVAYGTGEVTVADTDGLMKSIRKRSMEIKKAAKNTTDFGTAGFLVTAEALGDLPVKNWSIGQWPEGAKLISGQRMAETILVDNYGCGACFIKCGRTVKIDKGKFAPVSGGGPEYETLACLGSNCLVDDLEAIAKANELCNRYGLDTISTGSVIAFAMEAFERGLLTLTDTGGMPLTWGNADAVIATIEQIAFRKGLGELLGQGVRRVSSLLGPEAEEFAVHVKGLEFPAHDPRCFASKALAYATSNRGACHLQGASHFFELGITEPSIGVTEPLDRFRSDGKGWVVKSVQDASCLYDSVKVCKFIYFGASNLEDVLVWFNAVTGHGINMKEFLHIGERIFNLKRLYNIACGITFKDDIIPPRILMPLNGGTNGHVPNLEIMLSEYYAVRGWTQKGVPTQETLKRLELLYF
jgi:aldehyde:ferredoxin oxidoreductase